MSKKINIGLALSRNFDKITIDMVDEPIVCETDEQFANEVRKRFALLRGLVEEEFSNVQK